MQKKNNMTFITRIYFIEKSDTQHSAHTVRSDSVVRLDNIVVVW